MCGNVDIDDAAWEQASLPLRLGGLGVRSVVALALPCHLASLHASLTLTQQILSYPNLSKLTPALHQVRANAAESLGGTAQLVPTSEEGKQFAWDEAFARKTLERLLQGDSKKMSPLAFKSNNSQPMRRTTLPDTAFEKADNFLSNECIHTRFPFQIASSQGANQKSSGFCVIRFRRTRKYDFCHPFIALDGITFACT